MGRGFLAAPPFLPPMGLRLPGAPPMMPLPPTTMPTMPPLPVQSQGSPTAPGAENAGPPASGGMPQAVPAVSVVPNLPFPLPAPVMTGAASAPVSLPGVAPQLPQSAGAVPVSSPAPPGGAQGQTAAPTGTGGGGQAETAVYANATGTWPLVSAGAAIPAGGAVPAVAGYPLGTLQQPFLAPTQAFAQQQALAQQMLAQQALAQQALLQQQALATAAPPVSSGVPQVTPAADQDTSGNSNGYRVQSLPKSGTYSTRGRGAEYSTRG